MADIHHVREPAVVEAGPGIFIARVIYFIFGVIIAFLILRFVLLLLAANQGNGFVDFVYSIGAMFASPFFGIFGYTPTYGSSVFEVSTLVAIFVYLLIAWALSSLATIGSRRRYEV